MRLILPLSPQPKQRARITKAGVSYTPKETARFERALRLMTVSHPLQQGPLCLDVTFVCARPKRLPKRLPGRLPKATRPDVDNYTKALLDGLQGSLFDDDAQLVEVRARKVYAALNELPCIELELLPYLGETA